MIYKVQTRMLTVLLFSVSANTTYAQYGFGTNQPSKASVIEANSANKGILIPRVALNTTNNFEPVNGINSTAQHTVNSLLVYNTANGGSGSTAVTPGYYYWLKPTAEATGRWVRMINGNDLANAVAATTNILANNGVNTLTSTVNGVSSSTGMVNTVNNSLTGATLTTTVNNIASNTLNLTPAVTAAITNSLTNNGINTLTSTINGVSANAVAVNRNTLNATNGNLVSTVNGVASTPAVTVLTNATNGLNSTNGTARLGGALTAATAINTGSTNTLAVTGLGTGLTTDNILVADTTTGVLKQMKAVMPKFFYMPSVVFDISVIGTYSRNLYNEYINQFGTPAVKSAGAVEGIPTLLASQLEYYITYYDTNIFENLSIDQNGVLTYRVKNSSASEKTFMNIVFVVKK